MHPVNLIASAIPDDDPEKPVIPEDPKPGLCCVTGQECMTVARKQLFGKSFMDGDRLAQPSSDRVGCDAYITLKYKWERKSSWICDGVIFERLDRKAIRQKVIHKIKFDHPWVAYATTSWKKHGALKTKINTGNQCFWIFENTIVDCSDQMKVIEWWNRLLKFQKNGISRTTLETMVCSPYLIKLVGIEYWLKFQEWAQDKYQSPLYKFLCFLLPSQEELKEERKAQEEKDENNASKDIIRKDNGVETTLQETLF